MLVPWGPEQRGAERHWRHHVARGTVIPVCEGPREFPPPTGALTRVTGSSPPAKCTPNSNGGREDGAPGASLGSPRGAQNAQGHRSDWGRRGSRGRKGSDGGGVTASLGERTRWASWNARCGPGHQGPVTVRQGAPGSKGSHPAGVREAALECHSGPSPAPGALVAGREALRGRREPTSPQEPFSGPSRRPGGAGGSQRQWLVVTPSAQGIDAYCGFGWPSPGALRLPMLLTVAAPSLCRRRGPGLHCVAHDTWAACE